GERARPHAGVLGRLGPVVVLFVVAEDGARVMVSRGVLRVDLGGLVVAGDGPVQPALAEQRGAQVVVKPGVLARRASAGAAICSWRPPLRAEAAQEAREQLGAAGDAKVPVQDGHVL